MRDYCCFATASSYGGYDEYFIGSQFMQSFTYPGEVHKELEVTKPKVPTYELPRTESLLGLPQYDAEQEPLEDQIKEILSTAEIDNLQSELNEKPSDPITLQPRKRTVKFLLWNIKAIKKICKIDT